MRLKRFVFVATIAAAIMVLLDTTGEAQRKRGVVTFDTGSVVTADPARMEAMRTNLRIADNGIMDYLGQSMLAVQQGHRTGFQHFAVWFRNREKARENSSAEIAKKIFKSLLTRGLDFIFPEVSPFMDVFKEISNGSYSVAEKLLTPPGRDVNMFLERLRTAEEEHIKRLLDTPQQFRKEYPSEFEAAKWEWLEVWMEDAKTGAPGQGIPSSVRAMLDTLGVPPPGSATATRVAEGVLISHIETILDQDEMFRIGSSAPTWNYAASAALSVMDRKGNTARICEVERLIHPMQRSISQKECDAARPR